jgi:hypothetical protein
VPLHAAAAMLPHIDHSASQPDRRSRQFFAIFSIF